MDSMMAVEIKQTLEREFEVFLTSQEIRSLTFAHLSELSAAKEEPNIIPEGQSSAGIFTRRNTPSEFLTHFSSVLWMVAHLILTNRIHCRRWS
jgi:hypothetical protein